LKEGKTEFQKGKAARRAIRAKKSIWKDYLTRCRGRREKSRL